MLTWLDEGAPDRDALVEMLIRALGATAEGIAAAEVIDVGDRAVPPGAERPGRRAARLDTMPEFKLNPAYTPTADQPKAIDALAEGLGAEEQFQTLLGATGTGKTFTMAATIERVQRPALVIAHNKTLAAQLCNEFREFFPEQRRRVLRQLLRLLPARGLRPGAGPLHREGLLDQRRDRPAAPRRHRVPVRPRGRDHRRLGLLHLRDRLAGALPRADAAVQGRRLDRPRGRSSASWSACSTGATTPTSPAAPSGRAARSSRSIPPTPSPPTGSSSSATRSRRSSTSIRSPARSST